MAVSAYPSGTRYRTLAASSSLREYDTVDHLRN
jgi:hypothetical protein